MRQTSKIYAIGIDPGWKNLGLAIVEIIPDSYKVKPLLLETLNPSSYEMVEEFVEKEISLKYATLTKDGHFERIHHVSIERYVSYANVRSSETENITSLIGAINMALYFESGCDKLLPRYQLRAIEWKVKLAQLLAKNAGFQNPSRDLDKKFSVAAAKLLIENPNEIRTDHEADALCLAAFPTVKEYFAAKPGPRTT
jgi:Holliday junction resolvasome RuvABC endonuclease subunit